MEFIYDPYAATGPEAERDGDRVFNTYIPPDWRKASYYEGASIPPAKLPAPIDAFLSHFTCGDYASKEFIVDFLATAFHKRNGTYLCVLSKMQGTGKGVLGDMARWLYGPSNVTKVRGDTMTGRFNVMLKGKQFVMLDEFEFKDKATLDRVKDLVNARIEIEKKGVDAYQIDNALNLYMATNRLEGLKETGRRFSIPATSDAALLDTFTPEEVDRLVHDKGMGEEFARYLWHREVTRDMQKKFESARANEVREANLAEWETLLYEEFFPFCMPGLFVPLKAMQTFLKSKAAHLKGTPGRSKFTALADKFPEFIKFQYVREGEGVRQFGYRIVKEFPYSQAGQWCETCLTIKPMCTHDKADEFRGRRK